MIGFIVMLALAADPTITTVMRGPMSAVEDSKQVAARTGGEWTTLWRSHASAQTPPAVDFSTDMVAAVFMGTQPTGGFSVEIVATRREADALIIEYVERQPGPRDVR